MTTLSDALLAARLSRPYYARILATLRPVASPACPTFAVDRWGRLYYSEDYLAALTAAEAGACIAAHEVEHLLRDHHARSRRLAASPTAWNLAADAEINDEPGVASLLPCGCVLPTHLGQPDGRLAEEYYSSLPPALPQCHACAGGSGAGAPQPYELPGPEGQGEEAQAADAMERLRDAVAQDVVAHAAAHGRGSVPAGVLIWADARVRAPQVDWRRRLAAVLGRGRATAGRADYAWCRPSRRGLAMGQTLPGMLRRLPRIGLVVDTSASMCDSGPTVVAEVAALLRGFRPTVWTCDARPARLRGMRFTGGGGTDLRPALIQAARGADLVLVVTDGDTPWPVEAPPVPITVILVGSPTVRPPEFCSVITINHQIQ